jgi:hypothetical protein
MKRKEFEGKADKDVLPLTLPQGKQLQMSILPPLSSVLQHVLPHNASPLGDNVLGHNLYWSAFTPCQTLCQHGQSSQVAYFPYIFVAQSGAFHYLQPYIPQSFSTQEVMPPSALPSEPEATLVTKKLKITTEEPNKPFSIDVTNKETEAAKKKCLEKEYEEKRKTYLGLKDNLSTNHRAVAKFLPFTQLRKQLDKELKQELKQDAPKKTPASIKDKLKSKIMRRIGNRALEEVFYQLLEEKIQELNKELQQSRQDSSPTPYPVVARFPAQNLDPYQRQWH